MIVARGSMAVLAPDRGRLTGPDLRLLIRRPLTLLCSGLGIMGTI